MSPVSTVAVAFEGPRGTLRGELLVPGRAGRPLPAVVVGGSWTTVRGQIADRYAAALAARGYAALSFDFTGYGGSDGQPRDVEDPALKADDLRAATGFLAGHELVDAERVGGLGVCASAGYLALAATTEPRLRALAFIAPWLHDAAIVAETYGGEDAVQQRVAAGRAARERYARTGEVAYVPAQSATDPEAAMPMAVDFYEDPARGAIPAWSNRFAVMAWPDWLGFDPIALAPRVTAPTLIVHSPDGAVPDGARRYHEALAATKALAWTDGSQFDFYDGAAHVADAADRAAEHFGRHLSPAAARAR